MEPVPEGTQLSLATLPSLATGISYCWRLPETYQETRWTRCKGLADHPPRSPALSQALGSRDADTSWPRNGMGRRAGDSHVVAAAFGSQTGLNPALGCLVINLSSRGSSADESSFLAHSKCSPVNDYYLSHS